jgi:hypothetical protein
MTITCLIGDAVLILSTVLSGSAADAEPASEIVAIVRRLSPRQVFRRRCIGAEGSGRMSSSRVRWMKRRGTLLIADDSHAKVLLQYELGKPRRGLIRYRLASSRST